MLTSTAHRLLDDVRRLFGPDKGSGMTVPVCDVGLDMPDQRRHGVERAAPDRLAGEDAEPGLDHVEPGGTLRSEVEVDLRMPRSEEHTSELQSRLHLVCRLLLEKKKTS